MGGIKGTLIIAFMHKITKNLNLKIHTYPQIFSFRDEGSFAIVNNKHEPRHCAE